MTDAVPSIRELFDAAAQLPEGERVAYLERACPDVERRRSVLKLLRAHGESSADLLDRSLADVASRLGVGEHGADARDWLGRQVGAYTLLDVLGEGGSSLVFRAERAARDATDVGHRVAVKVFRRILLGSADFRQFRRERAALAQLTHPHIARYIDGGVTEAGVAFIVLELVDGRRITDYARDERLDLRQRVRLLIDVCRAVEAAHRSLIVHRDLKPSNVLVTADGHVKLLDFGIAKFLDAQDDVTETAHRALTPAYAAPEQFSGDVVTTATDVYALGVLIGEVLTGQCLTAGSTRTPSALVTATLDDALLPEPARALRRRLRGDLDNVILKAVSVEPERRYASADALADDLQRYLDNRPVMAHPPSRWYRCAKFARRHTAGIAATIVAGSALTVGVAVALYQADAARAQAARAESTRDFMIDLFRSAEPAGPLAKPVTVIEITEAAAGRVTRDASLYPDVRVDLLAQLGAVLRGQSAFEQSIAVLRPAAEIAEAAGIARSDIALRARLELAQSYLGAGQLDRALIEIDDADGDFARAPLALRVLRDTVAASVYSQRREVESALASARRAVAACATGDCDAETEMLALETMGDIAGNFAANDEAAVVYERAVAIARVHFGDVHVRTANVLNGLCGAYRRLGKLVDARRTCDEVATISDRTLPPVHWRRAIFLNYQGNLQAADGRPREAIASFLGAIAQARAVYGANPPELSNNLSSAGVLYGRLGDHEQAVAYLTQAMEAQKHEQGVSMSRVAMLRCMLGHELVLSGRLAEGRPLCMQSVDDLSQGGIGEKRELANALVRATQHAMWAGDAAAAVAHADRTIAVGESLGDEWPKQLRWMTRLRRACAAVQAGERESQRAALVEAIGELDRMDAGTWMRVEGNAALVRVALAAQDLPAARAYFDRARALQKETTVEEPFVAAIVDAAGRELAAAAR